MKIALIGATGFVGAALLTEALARGHQVTALVRDITKLPAHPQLSARAVDVFDAAALAGALRGHDAVLSAYNPGWGTPDIRTKMADGGAAIINATRAAAVPRLLVVGGAGSLEVAPGLQALDTPDFPAAWKDGAEGTRDFLIRLRDTQDLDWSFLSPAFDLFPGEHRGSYRVGGDQAFFDAEGKSRISAADYALAMIDELEVPRHTGRRFCVAY
ncbi:NAD(P)-dependent oxidoreductase [Niveibacterium sp. 24ML]|uniref:NAD(P)-dependent oxidoreductase n=1 Tax=Niveibacterium sp. 24ML TaxID=2985512 RepID=UPI002271B680|nr:NAD(P)-dependent oxidoreductase [Niveibacterium sp. 24ML]MCX9155696.1 NAD(P)-dependent oxidoreductase [Niveibacterium sp. 24ML]